MAAQAEVVGNRQVEGSNPSGPTISRFSGPMAVRDKVSAARRGHDGIDRLACAGGKTAAAAALYHGDGGVGQAVNVARQAVRAGSAAVLVVREVAHSAACSRCASGCASRRASPSTRRARGQARRGSRSSRSTACRYWRTGSRARCAWPDGTRGGPCARRCSGPDRSTTAQRRCSTRPRPSSTVTWAGAPSKPISFGSARTSFRFSLTAASTRSAHSQAGSVKSPVACA